MNQSELKDCCQILSITWICLHLIVLVMGLEVSLSIFTPKKHVSPESFIVSIALLILLSLYTNLGMWLNQFIVVSHIEVSLINLNMIIPSIMNDRYIAVTTKNTDCVNYYLGDIAVGNSGQVIQFFHIDFFPVLGRKFVQAVNCAYTRYLILFAEPCTMYNKLYLVNVFFPPCCTYNYCVFSKLILTHGITKSS